MSSPVYLLDIKIYNGSEKKLGYSCDLYPRKHNLADVEEYQMSKRSRLFVFLSIILLNAFCTKKEIDIEKEKEVIKETIIEQTKDAYALDLEKISENWVHEPYAFRTYAQKNSYTEVIGWENLSSLYKNYKDNHPPIQDEAVQENWMIRVYGNGAWVTFDQYKKGLKAENPDYAPTREFRVLEKTAEGWKIAYLGVIDRNSYNDQ